MVVKAACLILGLFLGLLLRERSAAWRRRSFSIFICRRNSFCLVTRSHSRRRNSSSEMRGGEFIKTVDGDDELLLLEML